MANITSNIYDIVRSHNGIKCADIVKIVHKPTDYVSGRLSHMKYRGIVFNEHAKWHATVSIYAIQCTLDDAHNGTGRSFGQWAEGYVSALADHAIISENEFDKLISYIQSN